MGLRERPLPRRPRGSERWARNGKCLLASEADVPSHAVEAIAVAAPCDGARAIDESHYPTKAEVAAKVPQEHSPNGAPPLPPPPPPSPPPPPPTPPPPPPPP